MRRAGSRQILEPRERLNQNQKLRTAEPRRVFEPHELAAYEAWGIIERDEHLIRLSDLGGEPAKRNTFKKQIYRRILSNPPQYRSAVERMGERHLRIITFHDLADTARISF